MAGKTFISDNLVNIRHRLKAHQEAFSEDSPEPEIPRERPASEGAREKRQAELRMVRRDLAARFAQELAASDAEIDHLRRRLEAEEAFRAGVQGIRSKLEALEETEEAGTGRQLENFRLDFFRFLGALGRSRTRGGGQGASSSLLGEYFELSRGQRFRLMFGLFVPVCLALLLGFLLVCGTIAIAFF